MRLMPLPTIRIVPTLGKRALASMMMSSNYATLAKISEPSRRIGTNRSLTGFSPWLSIPASTPSRPAPEDLRGVLQRLPVRNRAHDEADKGLHIVFSYFC